MRRTPGLRLLSLVLTSLACLACGSGGSPHDASVDADADAARDAALPPPPEFTATADPGELTDCQATPPAAGVARAYHVHCTEELPEGVLVMGRVGDILLENSEARFVIRTSGGSATLLGGSEGQLVDAAARGQEDQLKEAFPAFDLGSASATRVVVSDAGGDGEASARVLFDGSPLGILGTLLPGGDRGVRLHGAVDYTLAGDEGVLRVHVEVTPNAGLSSVRFSPGATVFTGTGELVQPFVGLLEDDFAGGPRDAMLLEEGDRGALGILAPSPGSVTHVKSIHLLSQTERVTVLAGETFQFEYTVAVAERAAEVYSALRQDDSDAMLSVQGTAGDSLEIRDERGTLALRTRLDESGQARLPLPPGDYALRPGFDGIFEGSPTALHLDSTGASATLPAAASGTLEVHATAEGDAMAPVRVTAIRADGLTRRFVAIGGTSYRLPPGDWTITVARGLEFERHDETITLAGGGTATVTASIDRVLDTSGWVSGDFHLHTEMSDDSLLHVVEAIQILAAEGLDVAASTDHDFVTNYPQIMARAGVSAYVLTVSGVEVSPLWAHIQGFPLRADLDLNAGGAPNWLEVGPSTVYAAIRERGDETLGGAIVQMNHPRKSPQGYFRTARLDRDTGHVTATAEEVGLPPTEDLDNLDFDAIEVWNGAIGGEEVESFADYLALLTAGRRFTMVGNSDSHVRRDLAGSPRTFLQVGDDTPGAWDFTDVNSAIRAGHAEVSVGVFVTAELTGPVTAGMVPVHVRVQAPSWIEVSWLRFYAGRDMVLEAPIDPSLGDPVRVDASFDVPVGALPFVVVQAGGDRPAPPVVNDAPFGITNALWVAP